MFRIFAGFFGFSAVLLGALGSHAISLGESEHAWDIATRYQLIHALLLLYFAERAHKIGALFVVAGILLFCGNIYLKVLWGPSMLTSLVPAGGICFMLAWICVGFCSRACHLGIKPTLPPIVR